MDMSYKLFCCSFDNGPISRICPAFIMDCAAPSVGIGDGMSNGVDVIAGIFVGVEVGVNVESSMKKVAVAGTKGTPVGCAGNAALSELGMGTDPNGRIPAKKIPVMAMAAMPMPMSNPMPRYFKSGCILIR